MEKELDKIKENPYAYIQEWMEGVLLYVGSRSFAILSLMPCSLILPPIPFGSSTIRSTINTMIVAPPSSGKTTLCNKFAKITYFPLQRRVISAADLSEKAIQMKMLSVIIEDFSQTTEQGYDVIKVLEGILGEEQNVNKSNMRTELLGSVTATGLLCGTPTDLEHYAESLEGGLLSRCVLLLVSHTAKQHSDIGDYINGKIGNTEYSEKLVLMEETAIAYYKELKLIQEGKHKQIRPIKGYSIPDKFKKDIGEKWKKISERLIAELGDKYYIRDLHEFYRMLLASAFLNVYNRKHDNGILIPSESDFEVAKKLMIQNMQFKWAVETSLRINRKIRSFDRLKEVIDGGMPESVKNILINISPYGHLLKGLE